jgi:eukaryotic-like serine/threonine-protein kinase
MISSASEGDSRKNRTLGDFRILQKIGEGGMGTVYAAEQISLKRRVALKVLSSHLSLSDAGVRKFRREAEAGGRQSHPGIVSVYAVGEEEGVHFIAQELIEEGRTLADRLDELRRETEHPSGYFREVAQLIIEVAEALSHAHASKVIHRDVKPSNILLTPDGVPKVSDFGLAKVEDALALSRTGDFVGTPYYTSPEQAASRRIGIDHRTDIFSLGATLYEALTFSRAFNGDTSQQVLKKILLDDPVDPRKIRSRVPRDLSVVCLKALEKKPERRYQSMSAFADDLRRFLGNEPILAKPQGPVTFAVKLVKRHPVISASGAVALVAFVIVCFLLLKISTKNVDLKLALDQKSQALDEARRERERASDESGKAKTEAAITQTVLDFIVSLFESTNPATARGAEVTAKEILDRGVAKIADRFDDQPKIRARLLSTMGVFCNLLGQLSDAEPLLREVLEIYRGELKEDLYGTLSALNDLAVLLLGQGRYSESEPLFRESLERACPLLGEDDPGVLEIQANLVQLLTNLGRFEEAVPLARETLEKSRTTFGEDHSLSLGLLINLATLQYSRGRYVEAESIFREGLEKCRRSLGEDSRRTISYQAGLGAVYVALRRYDEAEPLLVESLEKRRLVLGEDHADTLKAANNLASLYWSRGRLDDAEPLFREILEKRRRLLGSDHHSTVTSMNNLANLCMSRGRWDDAEPLHLEAYEKRRSLLGDDHLDTLSSLSNLGALYLSRKEPDKAEPYFRKSLEGRRAILGRDHPDTLDTQHWLAVLYTNLDRFNEARALSRDLLDRTPEDDPRYAKRKALLGRIEMKLPPGDSDATDSPDK